MLMLPFPIVSRYRLPLITAAIPFAAAWLARAPATWELRRHWLRVALGGAGAITLIALALDVGWNDLDRLLRERGAHSEPHSELLRSGKLPPQDAGESGTTPDD